MFPPTIHIIPSGGIYIHHHRLNGGHHMFVYSFRASTAKFFGVILLSVAALITMVALIPTYQPSTIATLYSETADFNFSKIKTNEDRIAFLTQFGWTVQSNPIEEVSLTIPAEFDKVFVSYNELQKQQGLDLSKYKRKSVTRYTYIVTNYPDYSGTVYANIIVYRGRVIGGDICTADICGFVRGLNGKSKLP